MQSSRIPLRRGKNTIPYKTADANSGRQVFTEENLKNVDIPKLMCEKFQWEEAKSFQVEATRAQLLGKNVLVHASTGSGKTAIAAGPHIIPGTKGEVTLFVAPLLALHTEMTKTFKDKYHLSAIAVNSLIQGGTKQIFKDIVDGKYQIVILAPEMLLHRRFVEAVLKSQSFRQRLRSVVIDEAHCISHWGDSFRQAYGAIGMVRAFLLPHTSIVAMSGTLTRRVKRHICKKLGFSPSGYLNLNEGNGRSNVSIISLPMQHPADSFHDADILIPSDAHEANDIPKTFVYCDNKDTIYDMVDHLRTRLPPTIDPEVIRPFTASQSAKYRSDTMDAFAIGIIRVLVCTEAAGMGCDIPGVKRAVQWKTPKTTTNAVQRAGRPARNPNEDGLYIQFNEPASYRINPTDPPISKPKKSRTSGKGKEKQKESEAELEPQRAGDPAPSKPLDAGFKSEIRAEPDLHKDSPGEGIYCFVQTTLCRRRIWDKVFENSSYALTAPCCDLCDPTLLDRFKFTIPHKQNRAPRVTKCELSEQTANTLKEWRDSTFERDYPTASYDSDGFMENELIEQLSAVNSTVSLEALTASVSRQWEHWDKYKDSIFAIISGMDTQLQDQPPTSFSGLYEDLGGSSRSVPTMGRSSKRPRLSAPTRPRKRPPKQEKLSQHETRFDDWQIQTPAPTEEGQVTETPDVLTKYVPSWPLAASPTHTSAIPTQHNPCWH